MKRVSDRQRKRLDEYKKLIAKDSPIQTCERCGVVGTNLERHHPHRRLGDKLFVYIFLCSKCHSHTEQTSDPEFLQRDYSAERSLHDTKPGENFLKNQ